MANTISKIKITNHNYPDVTEITCVNRIAIIVYSKKEKVERKYWLRLEDLDNALTKYHQIVVGNNP